MFELHPFKNYPLEKVRNSSTRPIYFYFESPWPLSPSGQKIPKDNWFQNIFFYFRRGAGRYPIQNRLPMRGWSDESQLWFRGDHSGCQSQLRQVQHRHLQRRRQDPLERQLYVAQDPTHPSEQVRINSIIITITHVAWLGRRSWCDHTNHDILLWSPLLNTNSYKR